ATAGDHLKKPSALTCTGCHDDINPGDTPLNGLAPGAGHVAGAQPDAYCRLCHTDTQVTEFDNTIPGAHVIPLRSATLAGLQAEILSATGAASTPVTVTFRLKSGGSVITPGDLSSVRLTMSGPTTDFGDNIINATVGSSGTLTGPDGAGVFTYTTSASLPADA